MNAFDDVAVLERPVARSVPDRTRGLDISFDGVSKGFGDRSVLRDVDFRVAPGEFVAIVGRSGSGKSTLLRLMAGLEQPEAGIVALGGKKPAAQGNAVRIMFQDGRLLPWRRVIDNVALGLPRADRPRAVAALAATGLADRAQEWPRVLSGGQKQRVALARALATQPKLILLDEPLGALDALTRLEMQRLIEGIWQKAGFTAVLVTHDVAEAALLADRVVLVEQGRIALDLRIDLPRLREPGEEMSRIERTVLHRILAG
jgi:sulfonate transport system ATP-binding protein